MQEEVVMNENFVKSIYKTLVEDGKDIYRDLYENTKVSEKRCCLDGNIIE